MTEMPKTCKQCSAVYLQGLLSQQGDLLKVDKENLGLYLQPNFVLNDIDKILFLLYFILY